MICYDLNVIFLLVTTEHYQRSWWQHYICAHRQEQSGALSSNLATVPKIVNLPRARGKSSLTSRPSEPVLWHHKLCGSRSFIGSSEWSRRRLVFSRATSYILEFSYEGEGVGVFLSALIRAWRRYLNHPLCSLPLPHVPSYILYMYLCNNLVGRLLLNTIVYIAAFWEGTNIVDILNMSQHSCAVSLIHFNAYHKDRHAGIITDMARVQVSKRIGNNGNTCGVKALISTLISSCWNVYCIYYPYKIIQYELGSIFACLRRPIWAPMQKSN